MHRHVRRLALGAAAALWATGIGAAIAEPADYVIDPDHFSMSFSVDHIGFADVIGMFTEGSGQFTYDEETQTLTDLTAVIEAVSVFSAHEARDRHLRGGDFLDAEAHPQITFVGTSAEATGPDTGLVHGDLTIRGVTQPVTLSVTLNRIGQYPFPTGGSEPNTVLGASVETTIARSAFGMTYAVDNGWVGDDVAIRIELEAIRQ